MQLEILFEFLKNIQLCRIQTPQAAFTPSQRVRGDNAVTADGKHEGWTYAANAAATKWIQWILQMSFHQSAQQGGRFLAEQV